MIDQIYCLHHIDLRERKQALLADFSAQDIAVQWVEDFHPSTINYASLNTPLSIGEVSLWLKHVKVLEDQVARGLSYVLVLEDDVAIPADFHRYIAQCARELEALQGDVLFVGECCGIKPSNTVPDKLVYYDPSYRSRCTHAYIISLAASQKVLRYKNDLDHPADHKFNHVIAAEALRSCYAEPAIMQKSEGSGNLNSMKSSLR